MHTKTITTTLHTNIESFLRRLIVDNYSDFEELKIEALSIYSEIKIQDDNRTREMVNVNGITISKDDFEFVKLFSKLDGFDKIQTIKYLRNKYSIGIIDSKEAVDYIQGL